MTSAFGGIFVADGVTAQTVAAAPAKLTCFTTAFGVRGSDASVVEDANNDQVKLRPGVYKARFNIDFDAPSTLASYQFHLRAGTAVGQALNELLADVHSRVDVTLTTDTQCHARASGFFEITQAMVDQDSSGAGYAAVAIFVELASGASTGITVRSAQLTVEKIF